jgi:hypothetical protein
MYYYKVEFMDSFGTVTAVILPLSVVRVSIETRLEVFNSAGELVASKDLGQIAPGAVDFNPAGGAFSPSADPSDPAGRMRFVIKQAGGGSTAWDWNGRNGQGAVVESGTYSVRLHTTQPGGAKTAVLRSVTVLKNAMHEPDPAPFFAENPASSKRPIELRYVPQPGFTAVAQMYNLAGELLARSADLQGVGAIYLPSSGFSSGIYIVEFELWQGQRALNRKLLKLSIRH